MKKTLCLIIFFVVVILLNSACNYSESKKVEYEKGFSVITGDYHDGGNVYVFRHEETGCYYTFTTSVKNEVFSPDVEQMYIEKNGMSVPYCE